MRALYNFPICVDLFSLASFFLARIAFAAANGGGGGGANPFGDEKDNGCTDDDAGDGGGGGGDGEDGTTQLRDGQGGKEGESLLLRSGRVENTPDKTGGIGVLGSSLCTGVAGGTNVWALGTLDTEMGKDVSEGLLT